MKKQFRNLLMLTVLGGLFIVSSCGDDPEDMMPQLVAPTLTVTSSQAMYDPDDTVVLSLTYNAPTLVGGLFLQVTVSDTLGFPQTDILSVVPNGGNDTTSTFELAPFGNVQVQNVDGFTVNNETLSLLGRSIDVSILISNRGDTLTATDNASFMVDNAITSSTMILLGAQGNANAGFYDALENERFSYAQARDASGVSESPVDFAYYFGNNNENSLAAIDDGGLNAVFTSVELPIEGVFGTRNSTRFSTSDLSAADFLDIQGETSLLNAATFEVGGTSGITNLTLDQVVRFQLDNDRGGNFGLIHIASIDDTNGEGTITINVKVAQD